MTFHYSATVVCNGADSALAKCHIGISGQNSVRPEMAQREALEAARRAGWLQVGMEVWCPACAPWRAGVDALLALRAGKWVPARGLRVKCARRVAEGVPDGQLFSAADNVALGMTYTIAGVRVVEPHVMLSFEPKPDLYYNAELFDLEQKETKETKGGKQ